MYYNEQFTSGLVVIQQEQG